MLEHTYFKTVPTQTYSLLLQKLGIFVAVTWSDHGDLKQGLHFTFFGNSTRQCSIEAKWPSHNINIHEIQEKGSLSKLIILLQELMQNI